jgi:predicted  nucleic acid-binding Zn-ribbon protein
MNLKQEICKLAKLQEIDSKIYQLTQQKDVEKPALLQELRNAFIAKKNSLAEVEERVKNLQLTKKDKELELASKEEGVQKAQGQLYQLKTNKEYQSKLSEISSMKADISLLEEEVLKAIEDLETAENELKQLKEKLNEEEIKFKEQENMLNKEIADIEVEIKTLQDKRNTFARDIDKTVLNTYEKLLETRAGSALAQVQNESCSACHMRVSHQKINEAKMYKELVFCESCLRILYIPEDIE